MKEDYEKNKKIFIENMNKIYANQSLLKKLFVGRKFNMSTLEERMFEAGYYFGKMEANKETEEFVSRIRNKLKTS